MDYPLKLTFKLFALAPQISVVDASGKVVFYVKQKLFKLKEDIRVFAEEQQKTQLYSIRADRIIDFSARYHFKDANGNDLGSVKRRGMRSLWSAHYEIAPPGSETPTLHIKEENPWVKVCDALFAELPIVGMFTGYVFNPKYLVTRDDATIVMTLEKIPSFFSRIFTIKQVNHMSNTEEQQALLSLMMMLLLERARG